MKSAKATSPFLLADVVFAAVVLALALSLGRQPPRAVVIDAAPRQSPAKPRKRNRIRIRRGCASKSESGHNAAHHHPRHQRHGV